MRHWMTGILSLFFFWIDTLILRYLSWSNPLLCPFLLPLPSSIFSSHAVIVHGTPPSSLPIQTLLASSSQTASSSTVVSFFLPHCPTVLLDYSILSGYSTDTGWYRPRCLSPSFSPLVQSYSSHHLNQASFIPCFFLPLQPVRLSFKQQERFAFFRMRVPDYFSISDCCQSCLPLTPPPRGTRQLNGRCVGTWGGKGDRRVSRESSTHFSHHCNLWTTPLEIGCRQLEWPKEDIRSWGRKEGNPGSI